MPCSVFMFCCITFTCYDELSMRKNLWMFTTEKKQQQQQHDSCIIKTGKSTPEITKNYDHYVALMCPTADISLDPLYEASPNAENSPSLYLRADKVLF